MEIRDKALGLISSETKIRYSVDGLNNLCGQVNEFVKSVGFDNNDIPTRIALIHSEISEAFEAYRKDHVSKTHLYFDRIIATNGSSYAPFDVLVKNHFERFVKDSFEDEVADSIIRLLDLCGKLKIDIEAHIQLKMIYNHTRGYKYGGKKF